MAGGTLLPDLNNTVLGHRVQAQVRFETSADGPAMHALHDEPKH